MRQINNVQGESGGVRVRRKLVRIDGAVKRGNQEREAPPAASTPTCTRIAVRRRNPGDGQL